MEQQTVVRLDTDVYKHLENKFRTLTPNENTSQLQAGFALGVQAVLKELREGYVCVSQH